MILKQDTRGRVRTPVERREALVAEFERSGLSATFEESLVWHPDYGSQAARFISNIDGQGRRTEWKLQTGASLESMTTTSQIVYDYTNAGNLSTISGAGATWKYDYVAGTTLIDKLTANGTGLKTVILQRGYDERRRTRSLAYTVNNVVRLGWTYGYDPLHPERREKTASLVNGLPGWAYDYNVRGEVTGASRGTGDLNNLTTVEGQTWGYAYDAIGNRIASTRGLSGDTVTGGERATTYQANALNQYTTITRPNALEVTGVTNESIPRVSINGQPATGRPPGNGEPGGFALWLDSVAGNGSDGQWPQVNLNVEQPGAGPGNTALTYQRSGRTHVRPTEQPAYDEDGNLVADSTWYYQWDAENRLVLALMKPDNVPLDVPLQMISYRYDAQGRRVSKVIYEKRTSTEPGSTRPAGWSPVDVVLFYYDGWNLMAEVSSAHPESSRRYIWGTDLSGTMHGAGGVGGLLGIAGLTGKVKHLPCTEVNGNIMGLIGAVSGELLTRWDYDAFGNLVTDWVKPGTQVATSPFKFSTKYLDEETGMYYYGFRFYRPMDGCWMSRDPIGERGGVNLYGTLANDPLNNVDFIGTMLVEVVVNKNAQWPGEVFGGGVSDYGQAFGSDAESKTTSTILGKDLAFVSSYLRIYSSPKGNSCNTIGQKLNGPFSEPENEPTGNKPTTAAGAIKVYFSKLCPNKKYKVKISGTLVAKCSGPTAHGSQSITESIQGSNLGINWANSNSKKYAEKKFSRAIEFTSNGKGEKQEIVYYIPTLGVYKPQWSWKQILFQDDVFAPSNVITNLNFSLTIEEDGGYPESLQTKVVEP